jgi:YVTN family beta-propeller protein
MKTTKSTKRAFVLTASLLFAAILPSRTAASDGATVIATVDLGANETAFALAVNARTSKTYVTPGFELGCDSQFVSVIDDRTNTEVAPIKVGLSPFGLAVHPRTNQIYVANAGGCTENEPSNTVSVIDGNTDRVVNTIALQGLGPAFVAINPKTNKIYVTMSGGCCTDGNTVAVIDGSTDGVHYVAVDLDPFMVAVNPRTNLVYVTHAFDLITVIDGSTDTVKTTFSIGSEAREIAFDPSGRYLYIAARNTNSLAVVDAITNTVVQQIPVGSRPHGVLFDPDNGRIYVTNRGRCDSTPGTVSVIDSRSRTVLETVRVGACPRFLDRDPNTGLVYVPNASTSRSVSVLRDED